MTREILLSQLDGRPAVGLGVPTATKERTK
jgi:hypothetical protein